MLGDGKSPPSSSPPPITVDDVTAAMTKLLQGPETRMEERIATAEKRWTAQPNPSASMPYGAPDYGSTTLASPSSTAPTLSTAPSLPITSS